MNKFYKGNKDADVKELLGGSFFALILKIIGMSLSYMLMIFITRQNGAKGVGFYSLFFQLITIFGTLTALGTNISIIRFLGQLKELKTHYVIQIIYNSILKYVFPLTCLVSVSIFFFSDYICELANRDESYNIATKITAIVLPFFTLNSINTEFIRGLKKIKISETLRMIVVPAVVLTCLKLSLDINLRNTSLIYFLAYGVILSFLISSLYIIFKYKWGGTKMINIENNVSQREIFSVSLPMMATAFLSILVTSFPIFFIDYYFTAEETGYYAVAYRLSMVISIILVAVNTISAPKFSELFWDNKINHLQEYIYYASKLIFFISLPLSISIIVFSNFILRLFGEEFLVAKWTLIVLVIGQLLSAFTGSVGVLMNMIGEQKKFREATFITFIMLVVFSFIFKHFFNSFGVALSYSMSLIFWNFYCAIFLFNKHKLVTFYLPFNNKP